jgi:CarD family transcriptional regulator
MAARKKVTKKVSKSSGRSGANRVKRKSARAQTSKAKSSRSAPVARKAKAASSRARAATTSKKGAVMAPAAAKAATSAKTEVKSSAKVAKARTSARRGAASGKSPAAKVLKTKTVAPAKKIASKPAEVVAKPVEAKDVKKAIETKDFARKNVMGAESAPVRIEAAGLTGTTAKPATVEAAIKPAPPVSATPAVSDGASKTAKTSASVKPSDRDAAGGEQKTMKNSAIKHGFKLNEFVVYPAHGVGQIVTIEEQEVAGFKLELFVINFVKDKMTLRVPTSKVTGVGMRKLSDPEAARRSLEILTGRARIKRTMWSRRAQEYEAKINSGDINAIAEVVRDLYRSEAQPEQSYSERQLYEAALDRMMREIAAVQKLSEPEALKVIDLQLKKNQKRLGAKDAIEGEDAGIEEAA